MPTIRKPTAGYWNSAVNAMLDAGADSGATPLALTPLLVAFATRTEGPRRIVFTGSSTTADGRYPSRLIAGLQTQYPSGLGSETAVVASTSATWGALTSNDGLHGYNAAESGTTAATYLTAAECGNIAAINPVAVIHMIGSNDWATSVPVATYKANVLAAVNAIKAGTTAPCVHILVHTYERMDVVPSFDWDDYGAALAEIANDNPGSVVFIDLSRYYAQMGVPGPDLADLLSTDNIHQTDAGYFYMAELMRKALLGQLALTGGPAGVDTTARGLPAGGARFTSDTFMGADAATLVGRSSDAGLGGTAKTYVGDTNSMRLVSNQAPLAASLANPWFVGFAEPQANLEFSFKLVALPTTSDVTADIHRVLSTGAGTPDVLRVVVTTTGTAQLLRRVSGVFTFYGSPVSVAVGNRIGIRYTSGTLSLYVNGAFSYSATPGAVTAAGYCGFAGVNTIGGFIADDIAVDTV